MTTMRTLVIALAIAACGGGGKKAADKPKDEAPTEAKADSPKPEEKVEEKAPEPAKPPPPKMWHAKADLAPVKGAKVKPSSITFSQEEGKPTAVAAASIDGLKPGKYHLMVHESKDCGTNASKAGKVMGAADVGFEVKKGAPGSVDDSGSTLALGGDDSVVGHALVLHDDAKGKPGKAEACGVITAVEDEDEAAKKE